MKIEAETVAGIVVHSRGPEKLARFYADALGLPLAAAQHGGLGEHFEGIVGAVHIAVWKPFPKMGVFVPVFRVPNVDEAAASLGARGIPSLHKPLDLGEGKRVATFVDPDGNAFRVIQLPR